MHIRTKWHQVLDLFAAGIVYTTAPKNGFATDHEEAGVVMSELGKMLYTSSNLPHFVIDHELLKVAMDKEFCRSLHDMKRAGVMRLPYPALSIEFQSPDGFHTICVLGDARDPRNDVAGDCDFYGFTMHINRDKDGPYLTVSPSATNLTVNEIDGEAWLKMDSGGAVWMPGGDKTDKLVASTWQKDGGNLGIGLFAILLLMGTKGVSKEVVDPVRLNQKRSKQGKRAIPRHTYIHIGHVYQKDGSTLAYDARKSPRPHWRRGHTRNVRVGPGRKETKPTWIEPMLVAFHGDSLVDEVKQPNYVVAD